MKSLDCDVVVIGNGCLGLTIARELVKRSPSTRVIVVGPSARPGSASLAAGAMINVWAELEAGAMADPALAARASLALRAMQLWDAHAQALSAASGTDVAITWGTYVLSGPRGPASEEGAFQYMLDQMDSHGAPWSGHRASQLPFLAPESSARAMRVARIPDGAVNSQQVITALDLILRRAPNFQSLDSVVEKLSVDADGSKTTHLQDGHELRSHQVVLAQGAQAQTLVDAIPALRATVPRLCFGGGFALDINFPREIYLPPQLEDLREVIRTMDRGGGCGMHLIPGPRGSRRFYAGATSAVTLEPEPLPRLHALGALLDGLTTEFHQAFFHAQIQVRGPGFRPVTMDAFPLLGESEIKGIWFCNGTKRDGFTCAPLLGREIAAGVLGERCDLPDMFRPCRPLISYRTRPQSEEAAVQASLASDEMRGLRVPSYRWADWEAAQRTRIATVYEKRGIEHFGIHPELLHFYDSDALFGLTAHRRALP